MAAPRAVAILEEALHEFHERVGMVPRVALLPVYLFRAYEKEMGGDLRRSDGDETDEACEVRIIEHEGITEIEVY